MKSSHFIPLDAFQSITLGVSEKICSEYLNMFIETSLKNKEIKDFSSMTIVYRYLDLSQEYFISFSAQKTIPLFEIFQPLSRDYDLILWDKFYFLYRKGQLYYFQALSVFSNKDELIEYLFKRFNFTARAIKSLDKEEYQELLEHYKKETSSTIDYYKKQKSTKLFFLLSISLFILLMTYYLYWQNSNGMLSFELDQELNQQKVVFKKDKRTTFLDSFSLLFNQLTYYKIQLIYIKQGSKKISIKIKSQERKSFLEFFEFYGEKIEIEYIKRINNDFEAMATINL